MQADGVVVGRNDLRWRCGRAQDHAHVYAGPVLAFQQVGDGPIARTGNTVVPVEMFHGLVRYFGVKGVGMDVDTHG